MGKPEIRFKGYTDEWEQRKLGDVAEFSKGSGYSKGDLIESGTPIILYGRLYTKYETIISAVDTFVEAKDGSVYSKGGEVIVPASGETSEDIARAASVDKSGILLGGDLNVVMPNEDINSAFLAISISNGSSQRELARKAQGKSVVHIHNEEIRNLIVPFPTKTEQNKIENYFADLDHLITLHQRKCAEIKSLKKYMLQKMFPQNEQKVPEIRFEGFTEAWEQRKFGSLLEETRNKTTVEDEDTLLSCAIDGMYLNSELFSHFRGSSNIGYLKIKKNDLILSAQNLHLGNCNVNLRFEHGIISPAYKVYELVGCNPLFMQAWVKKDSTKDFFLKASTEGASVCRKNIVWEELYKQELPIPNIEEQTKVGEYFNSLDHLITLHQQKCEELKKIKKFMLQKMFV